jgi:MFS family permease
MSHPRERSPHDWHLYGVIFFAYLAVGSLAPLVPEFQRDLALSGAAVGMVIGAYGAARLCFSLPAGRLAERVDHRRLVGIGVVCLILAHAWSSLASGALGLAGGQALAGVGSAFCHVTSLAVLARRTRRHHSGRVMGAYYTATFAGLTIGAPAAGYLAARLGWRVTFGAMALMPVLALAVLLLDRRDSAGLDAGTRDGGPGARRAPGGLMAPRMWPLYTLHFTALFLFAGVRTATLPAFGAREGRLEVDVIGVVLGIGSLATLGSVFLAGVLADRMGKSRLIATGLMLTAGGAALLVVSPPGVMGLGVATLAMDLGQGFMAGNAAALLADVAPVGAVGTAMGIMRIMADVGYFLGPVVLGAVADRWGYGAAFGLAAALPLLNLAALMAVGAGGRATRPEPAGRR